MVYRIKEKFWSWGGEFCIDDEYESPHFYVKGKAFSWGNKLSFMDANRNELAFISQKLMTWKPQYQIMIDGNLFAEVIKEWTWFNKKFTLDVPGPNDYTIEGSFWKHEYVFMRGGVEVAKISKKYWTFTDSYGVAILDSEDHVAILCACIVIDQVLYDKKN